MMTTLRKFVKSFMPPAPVDPQKREELENKVLTSCLMAAVVHEQCVRKTRKTTSPIATWGGAHAPAFSEMTRGRPFDPDRAAAPMGVGDPTDTRGSNPDRLMPLACAN